MSVIHASKSFLDNLKDSGRYALSFQINNKTLNQDLETIEGALRGWNNSDFKLVPQQDNDHAFRIMKSIKSMVVVHEFIHGGCLLIEVIKTADNQVQLDMKIHKKHKVQGQSELVDKDIWFRTSTHKVLIEN